MTLAKVPVIMIHLKYKVNGKNIYGKTSAQTIYQMN